MTSLPPSVSGFSHSIVAKSFPTAIISGPPGVDGTAASGQKNKSTYHFF